MVPEILSEESFDDALQLLRRYFGLADGSVRHEGASFETIASRPDDLEGVNQITPGDLVALATLSVEVKGAAAIALLESDLRLQVAELLAKIPPTLALADPDAAPMPDESSTASELWRVIRTVPGFGPTRTSKLLARKRPLLIPIYDSVIAAELGLSSSLNHWHTMRDLVTREDGAFYRRAARLREEAGLSPSISPLRVIDIILWRHGKDAGRVVEEDS
ncbi:DUF6308 family protein [Demequina sp. SO4-18]|uniref:DUF6308 family protein n=1 Tax=Demequina sp. SO4-18 TaxID=3401026 RepID=UPI003B58EBB4